MALKFHSHSERFNLKGNKVENFGGFWQLGCPEKSSVLRMETHTRVLRFSVQRRPGKQGFIHIPPRSIMGADPASLLHFVLFSSVGARPKLTKRNSMDSVELWNFSTVKVSPYHLLSTVLLDPPPRSQSCCCSTAEWGEPGL